MQLKKKSKNFQLRKENPQEEQGRIFHRSGLNNKTIKIKIKSLKSKMKDFIFNSTMQVKADII